MEKRIQIDELEPKAYQGLVALETYMQQSELSKTHKELIKIRASQINGCAFCINMHTKDALKHGESSQRIFLLNAWRESGVFTEEEQTVLQMTEEVTLIQHKGLTSETYQRAMSIFDPKYVSQIVMAITVINAWNRIAISTNKPIGH